MHLALSIAAAPGGQANVAPLTLRVNWVDLVRALGHPSSATVNVTATDPEVGGDLRSATALAIGSSAAMGTLLGPDDQALAPPAAISGADWNGNALTFDLALQFTAATRPNARDGACTPRWRVLHARNMGDVLQEFSRAARISRAVVVVLQGRLQFRSGTSPIIQAGQSDLRMLDEALRQTARYGQAPPPWWPLVRTGSFDGAEASRWVVDSASGEFHDEYGDLASRLVLADDIESTHYHEGISRFQAWGVDSPLASLAARTRVWTGRPYERADWNAWMQRPLPQFVGGKSESAWRIVDRLAQTGRPGRLSWSTEIHSTDSTDLRTLLGSWSAPRPWIGQGTVVESSAHGPTVRVRLPGYEESRGGNVLPAVLTTPYSGKSQGRGLHLVPEDNSPVVLGWSGVFGSPVYVIANMRTVAAELPSPSLWIEAPGNVQLADVTITGIGAVDVQSDLAIVGQKKITVTSKDPLSLEGNGGKAILKGGQFKTGRE